MPDSLLFQVDAGLAWLTLNRPEVKNAIDDELREGLIDAFQRSAPTDDPRRRADRHAATPSARAPISGGRREARCADRHPGAARTLMRRNSQRLIRTVLELEKPIVAAVNGVAAGMGAHLAFACDLVIAADEARFIEVFVRRGIAIDAGGAFLLSRLVGLQKAKELVFFADDVAAPRALRLGLCNKVVPRAELESAAREWGERLARGPTFALGMSKRLLNRAYESDLESVLRGGGVSRSRSWRRARTCAEGVQAFAERRKPAFKGR